MQLVARKSILIEVCYVAHGSIWHAVLASECSFSHFNLAFQYSRLFSLYFRHLSSILSYRLLHEQQLFFIEWTFAVRAAARSTVRTNPPVMKCHRRSGSLSGIHSRLLHRFYASVRSIPFGSRQQVIRSNHHRISPHRMSLRRMILPTWK